MEVMPRGLPKLLVTACALLGYCGSSYLWARSHHHARTASSGAFDYYLLSLSWAPDFCDQSGGNRNPAECGAGRQTGFVVHGLWPQGEDSRGPVNCAGASPVAQDIVRLMLSYIPTESLIQHEWAMHGTCTGLPASDYFAQVRKARDSIAIPADFKAPRSPLQLSANAVQTEFASANPRMPPDAFRVTCYSDSELQEVHICFDKSLNARTCGASAGFCNKPVVSVLPIR